MKGGIWGSVVKNGRNGRGKERGKVDGEGRWMVRKEGRER